MHKSFTLCKFHFDFEEIFEITVWKYKYKVQKEDVQN